jgi:pyruvate carboxylase
LDETKDVADYLMNSDVISNVLYPDVFKNYRSHLGKFGDTSLLPTQFFFCGMEIGEEFSFVHRNGRVAFVKLVAIGQECEDGHKRVFFDVNGQQNSFDVQYRPA